ncbi:hypothetical protein SAMN05216454_1149 [Peptostreptococcus russellii]|uniref:Uncharacterized protein n=1 Tax=Peptostreptococcus russellii TaxID=215200 RepID=A0A1H8JG55_9FIRM|nr:hypothetical protein [Peptostreptococcus russellii]SEN79833.1 hypothetical protein SAMN05216454_1149 [Peptostreptococcus russellii]
MKLYLLHENKEKNYISIIYYIKPEFECFYKEVMESDLPPDKVGYIKRLVYTKSTDTVSAEYEPIPKSETELLKEQIEKMKIEHATQIAELVEKSESDKLELSTAIVELTEQLAQG